MLSKPAASNRQLIGLVSFRNTELDENQEASPSRVGEKSTQGSRHLPLLPATTVPSSAHSPFLLGRNLSSAKGEAAGGSRNLVCLLVKPQTCPVPLLAEYPFEKNYLAASMCWVLKTKE